MDRLCGCGAPARARPATNTRFLQLLLLPVRCVARCHAGHRTVQIERLHGVTQPVSGPATTKIALAGSIGGLCGPGARARTCLVKDGFLQKATGCRCVRSSRACSVAAWSMTPCWTQGCETIHVEVALYKIVLKCTCSRSNAENGRTRSGARGQRRRRAGGAKTVPLALCEGLRCAAPSLVVHTQVPYTRQ